MIENLSFVYTEARRADFRSGQLPATWAERYPHLFTEDDVRLAGSQPDYHFFEWLTAILIHEATGDLVLLPKYFLSKHAGKFEVFREIASEEVLEIFGDGKGGGWPDLFVYRPGSPDYCFVEVKGGPDRLSDRQIEVFEQLRAATGRPVTVAELVKVGG